MCVAAITWQAHPDWPLLAIGNRDEFHERPAAPLARWDDGSGIIAGRDLQSGGTWLGVSDAGRFVLVTNLRGFGAPEVDRPSRGALVTALLVEEELARTDAPALEQYNPFNLFVANRDQARFLSNGPLPREVEIQPGIYGLSNGPLDAPWAKTIQLKDSVSKWLESNEESYDPLFSALQSEVLEDIGSHPRSPSDIPVEPSETPPFIRNPVYGTRCSTIVAVNREGKGTITERRFGSDGSKTGETSLQFCWPA